VALALFETAGEIAMVAPLAFVVGGLVGFVVGARFRIERRNGDGGQDLRKMR
jgi:hypothetical protein